MSTRGARGEHVLVVLPNWLGDLVMAMPLVDLLVEARDPQGRRLRVTACVRRRWAPLISHDGRLDQVITYERTGVHAGLRGVGRLAAEWRATGAGSVVICPPSLRTALVAWLARIPRRIGERRDGRGPLLTLPLVPLQPRGRLHHGDELRRLGLVLLEALGVPAPPVAAAAPWPRLPGLKDLAPTLLGAGPPLWVIAPGATFGPAKNWPAARVAEFLQLAVAGRGVRVAIVGDTAAAAIVQDLRRRTADLPWRGETPGPAAVIDLVGATTLIDLAALLKSSAAFIGNDSGVMHLAAALDVPTLGLFGSSNPTWTGPRGPRAAAITATGFACQPCYRSTCNQPVFCLDTLGADAVLARLDALLAAPSPERSP